MTSPPAGPARCCLTLYVGPRRGGCYTRLQRLAQALLDRGWTVHFVGAAPLLDEHPRLVHHPVSAVEDAPGMAALARASWRAARVCRRERIPLAWTFGAVYTAALAPLLRPPRPRVVTFLRGSLVEQERARGSGALRMALARAAERAARALSDTVVGVSRALAAPAGAKGRVLPNEVAAGAPPPRAAARQALALPGGVFLAGYAGAMAPIKSLETLLEAAGRVPGLHVALLGFSAAPSSYEDSLRAAAAPLAGRVHLLPWRADGRLLAAAADVVVLPSRDEGCPNLLLEALAAGRACLGARCAGIAEVLAHDALLFAPGDAGALAGRLRLWMDDGAALAQAEALVVERARAFRFDWDEQAEALLREATSGARG